MRSGVAWQTKEASSATTQKEFLQPSPPTRCPLKQDALLPAFYHKGVKRKSLESEKWLCREQGKKTTGEKVLRGKKTQRLR
jgi:hypothetical protein